MKRVKLFIFPILMLLTSIGMAAIAAFISVSGLGKLFAGAGSTVLLMTGCVEFSKIIITTYLHKVKYMKNLFLNVSLTLITLVIMAVTSLGVYGFLANGYTITAGELEKNKGEIALIENKVNTSTQRISAYKEQKESLNNRSDKLIEGKVQLETRLDSLFKKGWYTSARRVERQIKEESKKIDQMTVKVYDLDSLIQVENQNIGELKNEIIDLSNNDVNAELGPLKYIADLSGKSMDSVINYIILILIFIFDPAAILLLVAANNMLDEANKKVKDINIDPEPKVDNGLEKNDEVVEIESGEITDSKSLDEIDFSKEVSTLEGQEEISSVEDYVKQVKKDLVGENLNEESDVKDIEETTLNDHLVEVDEEESIDAVEMVNDILSKDIKKGINEALESSSEEEVETEVESVEGKSEELDKDVLEKVYKSYEEKQKDEQEFLDMVEKKNEDKKNEDKNLKDNDYLRLLPFFFNNGEIKKGQKLPNYQLFTVELQRNGVEYTEKLIRDFLAACVLVHIVKVLDNKECIALKNYEEAKYLLSQM